MGDYINRGPETDKVLDTLIELHETCANAVFLMGNHEYALLDYSYSGDPEALRVLRVMGIEATMESYKASLRRLPDLVCFPGAHREFLKSLKFCHLAGNQSLPTPISPPRSLPRCAKGTPLRSANSTRFPACSPAGD